MYMRDEKGNRIKGKRVWESLSLLDHLGSRKIKLATIEVRDIGVNVYKVKRMTLRLDMTKLDEQFFVKITKGVRKGSTGRLMQMDVRAFYEATGPGAKSKILKGKKILPWPDSPSTMGMWLKLDNSGKLYPVTRGEMVTHTRTKLVYKSKEQAKSDEDAKMKADSPKTVQDMYDGQVKVGSIVLFTKDRDTYIGRVEEMRPYCFMVEVISSKSAYNKRNGKKVQVGHDSAILLDEDILERVAIDRLKS